MSHENDRNPPERPHKTKPGVAPISVEQQIDKIASEALREARRREELEKAKADAQLPAAPPIRSGPSE